MPEILCEYLLDGVRKESESTNILKLVADEERRKQKEISNIILCQSALASTDRVKKYGAFSILNPAWPFQEPNKCTEKFIYKTKV